jgi:hypothetical protein
LAATDPRQVQDGRRNQLKGPKYWTRESPEGQGPMSIHN